MNFPFQFKDENDILFEVTKQGCTQTGYRYFILRNINGYWIHQREVKNASLNGGYTELEIFYHRSLENNEQSQI